MAARVICRSWSILRKSSSEHYRLLSNVKILTVASNGDVLPASNQSKRLYHCVKVQKSTRSLTAVNKINTEGTRHQGSLAATEADKLSDSEDTEGSFDKYGISPAIQKKLEAKGISHLFPVQYETYKETKEGWDVVVQARTGTGKTLSFGIPLVETVQRNPSKARGRKPKVIILEPTRELANQVAQDLKDISNAVAISCIYGGAPYGPQLNALSMGLDVVIGTPGRTNDMIEQGHLSLADVEHVVLDEVDRMLDMGFSDVVENIISSCYEKEEKPQTMMYSATMPPWVFKVARKYLKNNYKHVNLIGKHDVQTSTTVEHLALTCMPEQIPSLLHDVIRVYCGQHGRAMIFCQTKRECDQLASETLHKLSAQVLHGDIVQAKRDMVIKSFKRGSHKVLITTDVAARGLDIPNVELVIQTSPPSDADDYIHRSGRTGRAGKSGVSIMFFGLNDFPSQKNIERVANVQFKKISAPTPDQVIKASAQDVATYLDKVLPETLQYFKEPAQKLIEEVGAEDALAAAMAVIAGATKIKTRSLLTSKEGYTTYIFRTDQEMRTAGFAFRRLENCIDESLYSEVTNVTVLKDATGAVFDIPSNLEEDLENTWVESESSTLEKASELPDIVVGHSFHNDRSDRGYGARRGGFIGQFDRNNRNSFGDRRWGSSKGDNRRSYNDDNDGYYKKPSYRRPSNSLDDEDFFSNRRGPSRQTRSRQNDDDNDFFSKHSRSRRNDDNDFFSKHSRSRRNDDDDFF